MYMCVCVCVRAATCIILGEGCVEGREERERGGEKKGKEGGGGVDRVKEREGRDERRVVRREMKKKISTCN